MAGRIALVGGDEFRDGCEPMDEAILAATGKSSPVTLIVPTAAAFERPDLAAQNGVRHFSSLGADAHTLMALDRDDAMDAGLASEIASADLVYLTGGNPAHLLEAISESALLNSIASALERGAVLAGSSAGAMVMGSWMRFREWRRALGIVDRIATLPHHERADPDSTLLELDTSAPDELNAVLGVDGRCGALSGPHGWTALGPGNVTVYRSGAWQRYTFGDTFTIG